tara:strand:+ start:2729 stop:3565 length:837 start_codon:yes stop_codon:yes gene_type:complete
MNNKDITITILLYKTPLNLLKNLKTYKSFKILILDQSNDLINKKILKKILPNIKYYGISKNNKGFAAGQNYLIKKVKTKYFFCTQPDINLSVNSILKLKKTIIRFKKNCIIAVPKIIGLRNFKIKEKNSTLNEYAIKNMIGAAFMADKKKFADIGMFDKNFFFYWEDIDLSYRIMRSNYNIYLNLKSIANHISGTSSKNNLKTQIIRDLNFQFGELLYDYKVKNLRFLKVFRQLIQNLIFFLFNVLIFRLKHFIRNIAKVIGILKFIKFYLIKISINI